MSALRRAYWGRTHVPPLTRWVNDGQWIELSVRGWFVGYCRRKRS